MGIEWLSLYEMNERNENDRGSRKRYFETSLVSQTSLSELLAILPPSLMTSMDDQDGLGHCFRWFGQSGDGLPFFITCYEHLPEGMQLSFPSKDARSENYQWSIIDNFFLSRKNPEAKFAENIKPDARNNCRSQRTYSLSRRAAGSSQNTHYLSPKTLDLSLNTSKQSQTAYRSLQTTFNLSQITYR